MVTNQGTINEVMAALFALSLKEGTLTAAELEKQDQLHNEVSTWAEHVRRRLLEKYRQQDGAPPEGWPNIDHLWTTSDLLAHFIRRHRVLHSEGKCACGYCATLKANLNA